METDASFGLLSMPVGSLLRRAPVTVAPAASIVDTARLMSEQRVSSVLVVDERQALLGIVTDRDLRKRVVAAGLDTGQPVRTIATATPLTVAIGQPVFEALLLMARHNIHHLPVLDGGRLTGMITVNDLSDQHSSSAVYMVSEIHKQHSVDALAAVAARTASLQRSLAAAGASAYSTGRIITTICDALTQRLLWLAEAELGAPPVGYAWLAAGSQARSEQNAKSDQDNCMLLDDAYDAQQHGDYFKTLASRVNTGLDACGYVFCPGEMMACIDTWRQPLQLWSDRFVGWIDEPEPMSLMLTCVFFDLRVVHGDELLFDSLRNRVLQRTRGNRIFLSHMVGNALKHRPPLNMFGGISTRRARDRRDALDLKHSGIVPIVDLARIYALAGAHAQVNTHERLEVAAQGGEISERSAHDLRGALEFLATQRIRHQARQIERAQPPDNLLSLSELSNFERSQLKDAFGVVQLLQSVLAQRYR